MSTFLSTSIYSIFRFINESQGKLFFTTERMSILKRSYAKVYKFLSLSPSKDTCINVIPTYHFLHVLFTYSFICKTYI